MARPRRKSPSRALAVRAHAELVPATAVSSSLPAVRNTGPDRKRSARLLQAFFERRSALTVRNYRIDLVQFARWWRAGGHLVEDRRGRKAVHLDLESVAIPEDLDDRDGFVAEVLSEFYCLEQLEAMGAVISYQHDLKSGTFGQKYAPQTVNRRITALRSVVGLARAIGLHQLDLSEIELVAISLARDTTGCGEDGVDRLHAQLAEDLAAATTSDERFRISRNKLLVVFLHELGLRRFEAIQPRWPDDVDLQGERLRFRGKKRAAIEWHSVLSEASVSDIREYLRERGEARGFLFPGDKSKLNEPMTEGAVNKMVDALARRASVSVTPHGLRHTAATTLLEETDGNVRAVAEFLRHKNLNQVQHYDDERRGLAKKMSKLLSARRRGS